MADIIQSYGLFWRADDIYWGRGRQAGALYAVPARGRRSVPTDFRSQVGLYVLYSGHQMIYVGQTGSGTQRLLRRLKHHRKDMLAERWDTFSWFGLRRVLSKGRLSNVNQRAGSSLEKALNHMEAILIAASEPQLNRQGGRFGKSAVRFIQIRDKRLGLTDQQMLREVWKRLDDDD